MWLLISPSLNDITMAIKLSFNGSKLVEIFLDAFEITVLEKKTCRYLIKEFLKHIEFITSNITTSHFVNHHYLGYFS